MSENDIGDDDDDEDIPIKIQAIQDPIVAPDHSKDRPAMARGIAAIAVIVIVVVSWIPVGAFFLREKKQFKNVFWSNPIYAVARHHDKLKVN